MENTIRHQVQLQVHWNTYQIYKDNIQYNPMYS